MITDRIQRAAGGRAFSLVEVVIATAIIGILMGTISSVLVIASRAVDERTNPAGHASAAAEAVDRIKADLQTAKKVMSATPTSLVMVVPDRTGDGADETVEYTWSGKAGDPLFRRFNDEVEEEAAKDVQSLSLDVFTRTIAPLTKSPAAALAGFDDSLLASKRDQDLDTGLYIAEYFKPTLPAGAVSWSITKVSVVAKYDNETDGVIAVRVVAADGDRKPTTQVLGETTILESSLGSSYSWVSIGIGPIEGIAPTQGVCLVVAKVSGKNKAGVAQYERLNGGLNNGVHAVFSTDGGTTWTGANDDYDLRFQVSGCYWTRDNCPQ